MTDFPPRLYPTHGRMQSWRCRPDTAGACGFTLIELLIVVAIVGILAAIAIPAMQTATQKSRQRATMSDMRTLSNAIHAYFVDVGHYPGGASMADIEPFLVPHIAKAFPTRDAWSHEFAYSTTGLTDYTFESYGADGLPGANISFATRFDFNLDIVHNNGVFAASPN